MKATTRPTRSELLTLIDFFDHCQYPLLIHCKAGADRTGLASALYLMMQKDVPPQEAIRSLHDLPRPYSRFSAPNTCTSLWTNMQQWLGSKGAGSHARKVPGVGQERLPVGRSAASSPLRFCPGRASHASPTRRIRFAWDAVSGQLTRDRGHRSSTVPESAGTPRVQLSRRDSISCEPRPARMAWYDARSPSIVKTPSGFHSAG